MKRLTEQTIISAGKAMSLMIFIDIAYYIQNQKGMLSIAFPNMGNREIYKLTKGFANNPEYVENKDQMRGISERFYNNSSLKGLYKTLSFLVSKETTPSDSDSRMQDINRVLSRIERFVFGKLTDDEKKLFSTIESTVKKYGDSLTSNLSSSIESSTKEKEPKEEPVEKPTEKPTEKPAEEPTEKQKTEPVQKPSKENKPEEIEDQDKAQVAQPKEKTEEQFRRIIKRLVRESIKSQLKRK